MKTKRRIIPSITTLARKGSTWRDKLVEVESLQIREFGLFATGLNKEEREECFSELKKLRERHSFSIPFVHATNEMTEEEYRYCIKSFGTEIFNLHPMRKYPLTHDLSAEILGMIAIENSTQDNYFLESDLEGFGRICFDLSHLEDIRRSDFPFYETTVALAKKYPVRVNHISAVAKPGTPGRSKRSVHMADSDDDFDYLSQLSPLAFANLCAVELENSLQEQLHFIKRISLAMDTAISAADTNKLDQT